MNVCMVTTGHDARDDRLYFKEAQSLAKEHAVTLIAPSACPCAADGSDTVRHERLPWRPSRVSRALGVIRVVAGLSRRRFDVIHISDTEMLPFGPLLKRMCGARVVCDIWEANYERIVGYAPRVTAVRQLAARAFRSVERWSASRCDLVLTADDAIAKSLALPIEPTVIYNYPRLDVLRASKEEVDRLRSLYAGTPCILYHGSMAEERGILEAVEAMSILRRRHDVARLLLVGRIPSWLDSRIQMAIDQLGLGRSVDRIGWVDHSRVGAYLAVADVGIVPFARTAKFEKNIPQKIFEYWAAGKPVVGTDLTPIRRFVDPCGGGVLTPTNEPAALASALDGILANPDWARRMGESGRAMVEREWRWERMESRLLDAYRSLCQVRPTSGERPPDSQYMGGRK